MTNFAERDEYQVASLVGGFPVCTFRPKTYSRVITNIVVSNSVSSEVACYRGQLGGGVAVARNLLGSSNTIRGRISIPAGQAFFIRWSAAGASVSAATARVSWERVDNPLEASFNEGHEWAETAVTSFQIPTAALPDEPAILLVGATDLPDCMQALYSSAVFWRPPGSLLASGSAPYYFIAQRKVPGGGAGNQQVDHGFLLNDGVSCGYIIHHRVRGTFIAPDIIDVLDNVGSLELFGDVNAGDVALNWNPDSIDLTTELYLQGDQASFSHGHISDHCTGLTGVNTTGVYSDYPAGDTLPFEKRFDLTHLEVVMTSTFYTDNSNTGPQFAVQIDGTDYFVGDLRPGVTAGVRHQWASSKKIAGILQGSYTIVIRWARQAGTGSCIVDANDYFSLTVREVAPPP